MPEEKQNFDVSSSGSLEGHWYAVHTRSNFERRLSSELAAQGVETWLPCSSQWHQWKDRRKLVDIPVFPGYAFVRICDTAEDRLRVLRTTGAVRILGTDGAIEPVPSREIESIRTLLASGAPFFLHPFLRSGARVQVRSGALAGLEGILTCIKSQARLVLSVEMLSRSVAVEIDAAQVKVVDTPGVAAAHDRHR